MSEQILIWALGVLATVLGGLNIMQLLTFRAYKRQRNAEADSAEIESLSKIITQNQAEIGRLKQIAPALLPGPACAVIACMIAAFSSLQATM